MAELLSALSFALDLAEGQPPGHASRAAMIGLRLAQEIGMPQPAQSDLYYAFLLKDSGSSSNASRLFHLLSADEIRAKRDAKTTDWTRIGWESLQYALAHVATGAPLLERIRRLVAMAASRNTDARTIVRIRCQRGAEMARRIGLSEEVAQGIHSLAELYNGGGHPEGLRAEEIPLFSRIMLLAQTLEVFHRHAGPTAAIHVAKQRSGRCFDPDLVRAAVAAAADASLWAGLENSGMETVVALEPGEHKILIDDDGLDRICLAFADVIDAKSPFTYQHSNGVANAAIAIGLQLGFGPQDIQLLRRAALLHDIGKLSVPNSILEKPGMLDSVEWECVKKHPHSTLEVLSRIPHFSGLASIAAAHHEKLDGSGYFRHWDAPKLSLPARILAVADIYDALAAKRPYRDAFPLETVFSIMDKESPHALDAQCLEALKLASSTNGRPTQDLLALSSQLKQP